MSWRKVCKLLGLRKDRGKWAVFSLFAIHNCIQGIFTFYSTSCTIPIYNGLIWVWLAFGGENDANANSLNEVYPTKENVIFVNGFINSNNKIYSDRTVEILIWYLWETLWKGFSGHPG